MSAPTSQPVGDPTELTPTAAPDAAAQLAPDTAPEQTRVPARRLVALDAWRGLTILLMLLVNNVSLGRYTPDQLVHAPWGGGLTLTDLVFPWFLYCAGASLPFSLGKRAAGDGSWWPDRATVFKLIQRAIPLYLVGALLTSVENQAPTLGLGVLQLIALASLCAGLMARFPVRWRLGVALVLLVVYRLFLLSAPFSEADNAVQRLNAMFLNDFGLRGLTSVVPATALVLLGSVAAQPLKNRRREVPLLLAFGAALALGGWLSADALGFNKAVWTPAYILYSAGLGTLGMLALYLIGDARRGQFAWLLSPFTVAGRNSLLAYVFPILLKLWVLAVWQVNWTGKSQSILGALLTLAQRGLGVQAGGWVYSLGYVGAFWLGLWVLARRGFIWKL
ncbi:heparan-alpha-glucosaminide N-acetyltransferase domain-containing protein [Deinococcus rubellus]|uniref:Heparan-alpha-glucosaminide N-acetyltransferase domain-containing protein n=1 Tax=Deinococcus rubellus TaxID=1889240 RepID=A0ABY5YKF0_9DEIO|nr:heparan-alpha-glucosaminide N-acetyltransferase domain-containing protein [Deinococcus rubellus]UWX64572.1 heparan-alpha-glucosaminide N-acetyltransferase domain-containing protein [Deinococcus rubellus]